MPIVPEDQPQPDPVVMALASVLSTYPEARVAAIKKDGVFTALPESFPLEGHQVMRARSALDLVVPTDKAAIIAAWEQTLTVGHGRATVHLSADPCHMVTVAFLDARSTYGVFIGTFIPEEKDRDGQSAVVEVVQVATPRFGRTHKNALAILIEVDEATTQILGWSKEEMVGHRALEFIHPDDQALALDNWMEVLATPGPGRRVRLRHRSRSGAWVWLEITNHNLLEDPDGGYVLGEMVDISDEMSAHEALRAREQLLDRLADALPIGLMQIDILGHITYTNGKLHEILGRDLAGTIDAQLVSVVEEDQEKLSRAVQSVLHAGTNSRTEIRLRPAGLQPPRHCSLTMRGLTNSKGVVTGAILCLEDITSGVRMRRELEYRATYDSLTGCLNRESTLSALAASLGEPKGPGQGTGVIFVDLDRFKEINDQLGHGVGDQLLVATAEHLRTAVRSEDIVGRIGGDEFLVVCPRNHTPERVMRVAERIRTEVCRVVEVGAFSIDLLASIGVAWSDRPDKASDDLVEEADGAMYRSKHDGRGRPVLAESSVERPSDPAVHPPAMTTKQVTTATR